MKSARPQRTAQNDEQGGEWLFNKHADSVVSRTKAKSTFQSPEHHPTVINFKQTVDAKMVAEKLRTNSRGRIIKPLYEFDFYDHNGLNWTGASPDPSLGASRHNGSSTNR